MCILKKKYVKNYKVGVFLNKKRHDKLLSVEENWNKTQGRPKIRQKLVKNEKNW